MITSPAFRPYWLAAAAALALAASMNAPGTAPLKDAQLSATPATEAVFTVQGERATVRVLTRASACPGIEWDGRAALPMRVRAAPATVALRDDGAQAESKSAVFDVLTCEAAWPAGVMSARVAGQVVPAPKAEIRRIVIIADSGCRMKASENAFQACNDAKQWPFAQLAQSAAAQQPDLVIHIGDIHYRESPCPAGNTGCANSPWGYGYDAWAADLFKPAQVLLQAAPWIFVRGNHESCQRAGQGWFRFVDSRAFSAARACDEPRLDTAGDYSDPFTVSLTPDTQLLVFDSSRTSGKPFSIKDPAYARYTADMQAVNRLSQQRPHSFFMSHHPLLAIAPGKGTNTITPGGNAGLLSVLAASNPQRLLPEGVDVAMHGHLHYFEALGFKTAHPVSLVMGNSGSANDGAIPLHLPENTEAYPGAIVADYAATADYGFATLDRVGSANSGKWLLTEFNVDGKPVFQCAVDGNSSRCKAVIP
jgi:hypothetical protein